MGACIGSKGSNIKEIMRLSGARIKVIVSATNVICDHSIGKSTDDLKLNGNDDWIKVRQFSVD